MIDLLFVMLPHSCALDWAGPAEAFRIANQTLERQGKPSAFRMRFIGPDLQAVSSVGARLMQLEPLPAKLAQPSWVILLGAPDEHINLSSKPVRDLTLWLRSISGQLQAPHRLITVCAGALLAAQAGLLAGAQVTTHHLELEALRKLEPQCQVLANRVFVSDSERSIYSSAGITTGIDLAVHLIADVCGEAVAARVAQVMVMPMRRGPGDPEMSAFLSSRAHLHPAVHRVQDAVSLAPREAWDAERMAELACTSTRHLNRLFDEHVGMSPLDFLRSIRVELAEKALKAGKSVAQASDMAGFRSDLQLRRAWKALVKEGLPSQTKLG
ncbi:helix-turn-helix domain-containing protein [Variovorax sp. PCZ-1]|uniref:GlxA family transcriptional regulator n=1 Tax=Variovorax sp. PCZ-1 TaxID=2835533 RepID=UPI001BCBEF33|nr:helix-turn-helix domain-containing protein [Variovorax sp. PCZ-1]MBS7806644.1 helix-turn-helix domain-containing protein [Variovorax sp. PCZ-1]